VVSIVLLAFAWPTATSRTENLPVAVVGTQEPIDAVTAKMPDKLLDVHPVAHREDAVNGIRTREVYGGIVLGDQPEILTASAASPVVSQMLGGVATTMQRGIDQKVIEGTTRALEKIKGALAKGPAGMAALSQQPQQQAATPSTVKTTDVVPLSEDDPRGSGLAIAGLPLTMGGMIIGNPISALTSPKEFILPPFGEVGQWLVPGLSGTLLRDLSYFPDANIAAQVWALIGWVALGIVLTFLGHHKNESSLTGKEETQPAPVATA